MACLRRLLGLDGRLSGPDLERNPLTTYYTTPWVLWAFPFFTGNQVRSLIKQINAHSLRVESASPLAKGDFTTLMSSLNHLGERHEVAKAPARCLHPHYGVGDRLNRKVIVS